MRSRNLRPESEPPSKFPVKLEIVEDFLEEEHAPLNKRSKVCSLILNQIRLFRLLKRDCVVSK